MRAELANLNHCAAPFFKPRRRQLCAGTILHHLASAHICRTVSKSMEHLTLDAYMIHYLGSRL